MQVDPVLIGVVAVALAVFIVAFILRIFKQPHVIGYILVGIALGWFGWFKSTATVEQFANLGIILLLFFIGMHISLPKLICRWRIAVLGTLGQITLIVLAFAVIGHFFNWSAERVILFGFVASLSSTAVVLKILNDWGEMDTKVGQNVLSILLVQDLAIIPMMIFLELYRGGTGDLTTLILPIIGSIALIGIVVWVVRQGGISLPFLKRLREDHDMQIFLALILCFGMALLTGMVGLSPALGAFVGGFIIKQMKEASWVQDSLESLHTIFVALFFIYVGMLIDISFLRENWLVVLSLTGFILLLNTALNATVLRFLGDTWKESIYAGGLLSQIGEFSFLLVGIGFARNFISEPGYQLSIAVIAIGLLLSPFWIQMIKRILKIDSSYVFELQGKLLDAVSPKHLRSFLPKKRGSHGRNR